MNNPPIKFKVPRHVKRGLEKIADCHGIGTNEPSANALMQIVAGAVARIRPRKFFEAMAALEPHCTAGKFEFVMKTKKGE